MVKSLPTTAGENMSAHRRHDISDRVWDNIQAHLPGGEGRVGRAAGDNGRFINAVFWILRTEAPWRDPPPDFGDWKNTHRRFCRWHDRGVWEKLLEVLMVEPDYEWLMIDASHCKVHPHAAGAVGGNQAMSRTKGGSIPRYIWPWMRMVCRSELLLQRVPELIARKRAH
jgi:transposase